MSEVKMRFSPYQDESLDLIYNLAFCDDIDLFKDNFQGEVLGAWETLFSKTASENSLREIAQDQDQETRLRILANNMLISKGLKNQEKQLLGVILEVGLEKGLDMLAAYQDYRARYINQSGNMIFWEVEDPIVNALIDDLFCAGRQVMQKIGPWDKPRLAPPQEGNMRLTFLVSDGLYFGQGDMMTMQNDPLGGDVVACGFSLLQELLSRSI